MGRKFEWDLWDEGVVVKHFSLNLRRRKGEMNGSRFLHTAENNRSFLACKCELIQAANTRLGG